MNGHAPSNNTTAESQTRESAVSATAIASPPPPPATTSSRPCYIHYGQRSVKARIDPDVPLSEIVRDIVRHAHNPADGVLEQIRQLAASTQLQISEPPALFALREKDTGELITDENLPSYLARGVKYVVILAATSPLSFEQLHMANLHRAASDWAVHPSSKPRKW